jgi:allantoinase
MWTNFKDRGFDLTDLTRLMSEAPARLAGLENQKGKLAAGHDADIVVWDPNATFTVNPELVYHRHKLTPYSGREVFGCVESVYVRGEPVYDHGEFASEPAGRLII